MAWQGRVSPGAVITERVVPHPFKQFEHFQFGVTSSLLFYHFNFIKRYFESTFYDCFIWCHPLPPKLYHPVRTAPPPPPCDTTAEDYILDIPTFCHSEVLKYLRPRNELYLSLNKKLICMANVLIPRILEPTFYRME